MKLGLVLVLAAFLCGLGSAADLTLVPNQYGAEVVEAVVNIIRESCLFAEDKRFLRRLAYVESHDGTDPKTYRLGYHGGIWQVDQDAFRLTQNANSLSNEYAIIRQVMGVDWSRVSWQDLRKPLFSGIAAALYTKLKLSARNTDMNWRAEAQGSFWANNFHSGNSAYNFSSLANVLDLGCRPNQQVDLVMVLDTSSSLNQDDLARAKDFMKRVVQGFPIGPVQTQVGVISYSSNARVEFYLNNHQSQSSLLTAIDSIRYNPGGTDTSAAIDQAVMKVFNTANGARSNVVKVMVVITDGDSDDPINTKNSANVAHYNVMVVITDGDSDDSINTKNSANVAHYNGIITFSLGVGGAIHENELKLIASNPACTHVYKADDYAEIKFMVEEIQKATCIAPVLLQINQTYTCQLSHCPPFVGPTDNGVTLQTTISCGGMTVYSSFNNPYPSSAQYQSLQNTLASNKDNVSETFFNRTGSNLYINFKDNQNNQSANCLASVTLCGGDCTDHEVTVKCFQNNHEIPCDSSYFNCTEKWNFVDPCTKENILAGKLRFPHPYDSNKFLMCDLSGKVYVVLCPPGEVFNSDCSQCIGAGVLVSSNCINALSTNITNPCTRENILAGKLFFPYPGSVTKYIHCDIWGHPWERVCQSGMEWDQSLVTCVRISTYDPCVHHNPGDPWLYPHQCDPHKYIHCDTNHQSFVQSCQFDYVFLRDSQTCVPIGSYPGTSNLVNTCHGNNNIGTTRFIQATTRLPGPTSSSVIGYVYNNKDLHVAPCTYANIQANNLYFPVYGNNHQYIQCDLFGRQWLRDCKGSGRNYYDPYSHTCVDGPVFVDNQLG